MEKTPKQLLLEKMLQKFPDLVILTVNFYSKESQEIFDFIKKSRAEHRNTANKKTRFSCA